MSHTNRNHPPELSENLQKRKEKANLLEKIQTIESEISKIKSENGSLRAKLRLVRTFVQFWKALQIGRYPLFYSSVHSPGSSLKWTVQTTEKTKSGLPWNQKVNGLKSTFTL